MFQDESFFHKEIIYLFFGYLQLTIKIWYLEKLSLCYPFIQGTPHFFRFLQYISVLITPPVLGALNDDVFVDQMLQIMRVSIQALQTKGAPAVTKVLFWLGNWEASRKRAIWKFPLIVTLL